MFGVEGNCTDNAGEKKDQGKPANEKKSIVSKKTVGVNISVALALLLPLSLLALPGQHESYTCGEYRVNVDENFSDIDPQKIYDNSNLRVA